MNRCRTIWPAFLAATALIVLPEGSVHPQTLPRAAREDGFALAFVDADVRRVIDAVFGSMMNVDYSVDPAVTGNVTLRTVRAVTRAELLPLIEQALASVGAVVLVQGDSYQIVPRKGANAMAATIAPGASAAAPGIIPATTALPAEMEPITPGFASEIVTLRFASAREMARLLEEFLGQDIISSRNDALNQLVIVGTGEERRAARQIIARFDVDSLAQMNYEMFRLDNVDAVVLMGELQKIFAPPYDIIGSRVRLIPLSRLRCLLAVAADRADLERLRPWIQRLDVGTSGTRKIYNYAVQNGRARDIARSLQQLLSGRGTGERPGADDQSNRPSDLAAPHGLGSGQNASEPESGADRGAARSVLADFDDAGGAISASGVQIVPNDTNNSLLIYAGGAEYALIKEVLVELDQPVLQVLIEATLAEVTLGHDLHYGVDFQRISGDVTVTSAGTTTGIPASAFPGFSVSLVEQSTTAILNALQSRTNVRVLSAPRLFVLNNQPATLQVGDQVPIVVQQSQSVSAPGAPVVNTVELRDTGVILQVTPRVNQSGVVTLDISQEVSDVAPTTTSGINSPTIQQRRVTSTISTRTGQVVALGGLIRERSAKGRSGIPLLSQIPVLGAAFGKQTKVDSRTELIILIKPSVIRAPEEVKGTVDALIDGLDLARPLVDKARSREIDGLQARSSPQR